jgi:hypothetical protein
MACRVQVASRSGEKPACPVTWRRTMRRVRMNDMRSGSRCSGRWPHTSARGSRSESTTKDAAADVVGGLPVDVEGLAVLLEAILWGVALQWLAGPENVDLDSTIATARQMLRAVLGQPQPST